jgi:nucleoid-associated protein YgaU
MSPSKRMVPDAEDAPTEQAEAPAEQTPSESVQSVGSEEVVVSQDMTAAGVDTAGVAAGVDAMEERIRQLEAKMKADAEAKAAAEPLTYTVVYGDTLWGIAERVYGEGIQYTRIYEANKELIGPDVNVLYPDWALKIPRP